MKEKEGRKRKIPTIEEVKEKVLPIFEKYGVKRAGVFGSLARGEMRKNSDIDLLVEIDKAIGLIEFAGFNRELEEALGRKVDVGEYEALKPAIKERVLKEEVRIYDKDEGVIK